jgi:hypothetical protein
VNFKPQKTEKKNRNKKKENKSRKIPELVAAGASTVALG